MTIYPHKCSICKSPAIRLICSNVKCKSWKKYRSLPSGKIVEHGFTNDDPIIVRCLTCNKVSSDFNHLENAYCSMCQKWFKWNFIEGRWYKYQGIVKSFTMRRGIYWEWDTEILGNVID